MNGLCNTILDYPTANGVMPLMYSIRDCIPFAFFVLLVVSFLVLFAGNYFLVKSKTGRAKVLIALLSASFLTLILSVMLALAQLVTFKSVIFWAFLLIIWFVLFLISDYY
jgi:hypothetical protein